MTDYEGHLWRLGGELFIIGRVVKTILCALVSVAQNILFADLQLKQKHKNRNELIRASFVSLGV